MMGDERSKARARFYEKEAILERVDALTYEMAGIVECVFQLPHGAIVDAHDAIVSHASSLRSRYWKAIAKTKSLEESFAVGGIAATFDRAGNIVDVARDADIDPLPLLQLVSPSPSCLTTAAGCCSAWRTTHE